jgi:phosphoenolpyruvate carboxykinase (GTP)
MCQRVDGMAGAQETPIGLMPKDGDLDLDGLDIPAGNMQELMHVDLAAWKAEIPDIEKHFATFGSRLPEKLKKELEAFRKRLG